jgi:ATP-dependent helicase IRC3
MAYAPPHSGTRLALRPYQQEALRAVKRAYDRGVRRQLLVLPTGSGKTPIAACLPGVVGDPNLLSIAHRLELLEQTMQRFLEWRPDRPVGIERGDQHPAPSDRTVIATVQSLARADRLAHYDPARWPLMVCDEAHRGVSDSYLRVFRHFRHLPHDGLPALEDGLLLGITGTAKRTDNVGLGLVFQEVPYTLTLRDLIEDPHHYLVPLRGYLLRGGANLDEVDARTEDGERDFDPHALDRAVNTPARNRLVVDGTRNKALAEGRPTLVFAASVAHGEALAELFRGAGVRAANVHGEMPLGERREILERFRRGELQVLVNCALLLEGIDIPQVSAVVMARPTQSALLYSQAVGRGTRPHPQSGKRDCIVIDFVDNTQRHAASLVSLPTLFGLPPQFDLRGEAAHAAIRALEDAAAAVHGGLDPEAVQRIRSPEDIPRVFYEVDLLKIAGLPPHLSRITHFAWQRMPDGALSITIPRPRPPRPTEGGEPALAADGKTAPASLMEIAENAIGHLELRRRTGPEAPAKIAEYADLETALRSADQLIQTQYRDRLTLLSKSAAWRHETVTPEQLRALERLRQPVPRDPQGRVLLTRGQASLLIDRAVTLRRAQREAAQAASEPPTPKQLRYLHYYHIPIPDGLTKQGASDLIGRHRKFQQAAKRAPAQPARR